MAKKVAKKAVPKKESTVKKVASKVKELVGKATKAATSGVGKKASPAKPAKKAEVKKPAKAVAKAPEKMVAKAKVEKASKPEKVEKKPAKAELKVVPKAAAKVEAKAKEVKVPATKAEKPAAKAEKEAPKLTLVTDKKSKKSQEVAAPEKKEKKVRFDKTGLTEDQVRWHELHEKYRQEKAQPYSISGVFEAKTPIEHKLFGWGFILSNEYDRLEVLFVDGRRILISNRQL